MTLSIILGFLFGATLGIAAVLIFTALAVHHEKAKYKAICRDIELWKRIMEDDSNQPKKHSPEPESQRLWEQRWPYKENNHESSQPTL